MEYAVTFLEGIIAFISPCLLPLIPVYVSFFAGGESDKSSRKTLGNALGFMAGFTLVFIILGAFAGLTGGFLIRYRAYVNIVTGAVVMLFGLNYLGAVKIGLLNRTRAGNYKSISGFLSAILFGIVFSVGWTPCVGAFLGSALMFASHRGSMAQGIVMLLCFSLGLGIPFLLSAVLIGRMKAAFAWIKKHYKTINIISGLFLMLTGLMMMTGTMGWLLSFLVI